MSSNAAQTLNKLTGEGVSVARGLGEKRDLASDILGLKSWVYLLPNSVLVGWDKVSDMTSYAEKTCDLGKKHLLCE